MKRLLSLIAVALLLMLLTLIVLTVRLGEDPDAPGWVVVDYSVGSSSADTHSSELEQPPVFPSFLQEILDCIADGEVSGEEDPYRALNREGSSASGRYQITAGTWGDHGFDVRFGVPRAYLASPEQQDEAAVILLIRRGLNPWRASGAHRRCR